MFCPKCGTELIEGNKFCTNCGFKIEREATEEKLNEKVNEKVIAKAVLNESDTVGEKPKNLMQKKKYWIAGGVLLFFFLLSSSGDKETLKVLDCKTRRGRIVFNSVTGRLYSYDNLSESYKPMKKSITKYAQHAPGWWTDNIGTNYSSNTSKIETAFVNGNLNIREFYTSTGSYQSSKEGTKITKILDAKENKDIYKASSTDQKTFTCKVVATISVNNRDSVRSKDYKEKIDASKYRMVPAR